MTEDIEFLRSMAAACRKEARAERRRRPRVELMQLAERLDSVANRIQFQSASLNNLSAANASLTRSAVLMRTENT